MIVDASIALKWIKSEETGTESALLIYQNHIAGKDPIMVPTLFFTEVANALVTKSETTQKTIKKDLKFILESKLITYEPNEKDILQTARLAKKHNTSVYDMLYAVVARRHKTTLVTADDNFLKKTGFKFVKLLKDVEIDSNGKQSLN